jgi:hypothetical protein
MTQKYGDRFNTRYLANATQIPTSQSLPASESAANRVADRAVEISFTEIANTSGDSILTFVAPDDGVIDYITLNNGAVAADGSNGLELSFINKSNSDEVVAYIGFGSGTEAVKADDKDSAVAANTVSTVRNATNRNSISFGDKIQCTIDRDGTTIVGEIIVGFKGADTPRS